MRAKIEKLHKMLQDRDSRFDIKQQELADTLGKLEETTNLLRQLSMKMVFFLNFYKETEDAVEHPHPFGDSRASFASVCEEGVLRDRLKAVLNEHKLNTICLDIEKIEECISENEALAFKARKAAEVEEGQNNEPRENEESADRRKKPTKKLSHARVLSRDSCYTDGAFSVKSGESCPFPGSEVSSTRARNGYDSMCGMSEDAAKLVQLY